MTVLTIGFEMIIFRDEDEVGDKITYLGLLTLVQTLVTSAMGTDDEKDTWLFADVTRLRVDSPLGALLGNETWHTRLPIFSGISDLSSRAEHLATVAGTTVILLHALTGAS